jgi:hypothetical protein
MTESTPVSVEKEEKEKKERRDKEREGVRKIVEDAATKHLELERKFLKEDDEERQKKEAKK